MCRFQSLKEVINNKCENLALIIGNGVNRIVDNPKQPSSWLDLLFSLFNQYQKANWLTQLQNDEEYQKVFFQGITLTEFYDLLELSSNINKRNLQKEFCSRMKTWQPNQYHIAIVEWAYSKKVPILTTNFETTFSKAINNVTEYLYENEHKFRKTESFPWNFCYKIDKNQSVCDFGIWHINGVEKYPQSIRLGLSHYMQSIVRARKLIHNNEDEDENDLFTGKNHINWKGSNTWLHILFNCDLVIFGLSLEPDEVFLRWLLIQRAKYFQLFNNREKEGFYIYKKGNLNAGKKRFLESVGFQVIEEKEHQNIYDTFKC